MGRPSVLLLQHQPFIMIWRNGTKGNSKYGQKGTGHTGHCSNAVKWTGTLEVIDGIAMKRKPITKTFKVRTLDGG